MFDNTWEYTTLYPEAPEEPARFCAPRVEEGKELEAVRQRLKARAQALGAVAHCLPAGSPHHLTATG